MEIEYTLDMNDVLAFGRYVNEHSPSIRRRLLISRLVVPIICVSMWLVLCTSSDSMGRWVMAGALGFLAIVYYLIQPLLVGWRIQRTLRKLYSESSSRGLFSRRRLSITPELLSQATDISVSSNKWAAIEKIAIDSDHAYFFQGPASAFILPCAAFATEEEFQRFVETAQQYHREAAM